MGSPIPKTLSDNAVTSPPTISECVLRKHNAILSFLAKSVYI